MVGTPVLVVFFSNPVARPLNSTPFNPFTVIAAVPAVLVASPVSAGIWLAVILVPVVSSVEGWIPLSRISPPVLAKVTRLPVTEDGGPVGIAAPPPVRTLPLLLSTPLPLVTTTPAVVSPVVRVPCTISEVKVAELGTAPEPRPMGPGLARFSVSSVFSPTLGITKLPWLGDEMVSVTI